MEKQKEVEYVKHDPALARMSIFRPTPKGKRSDKKLDITFDYNESSIRVESMEQLDARDQTLLFVLVAMAGMGKEKIINSQSTGPVGKELWSKMNTLPLSEGNAIAFYTTFYRILKNCKLEPTGKNYKFVEESLLRLAKTNITIKRGKRVSVTRLIVSLDYNEKEEIAIAINPRIAEAVTGQYIVIDLEQRNTLKNDTAKILFSYLSSVINEGNRKPYLATYSTLIERTWGEGDNEVNDSTYRGRKKQIKDALILITDFPDWIIQLEKDVVSIKRLYKNSDYKPQLKVEKIKL